ncbi:MAG: InlB B-repeat-containing protein, partial [Clostridiales bacterium]|nr:InlB B-repeat-containing protein [Clostridiales bacterium]
HMQAHYDDGAYVVLYLGDSDQQYFALDIEIEFSLASKDINGNDIVVPTDGVSFKLTVTANNKNSWERYENGYGEPWGFYMGGLINSVKTWDPNRTTKLERATTEHVTSYDEGQEKEAFGNRSIDDTSITDDEIETFNADDNFNYKIINYGVAGGTRSYARYPKGKVDVSLTVNLTEGSLIKIYMLDNIGHRLDIKDASGNITQKNRTIYVMANEIVYDDDTKLLFKDETYDIYDEDLNIIIPKTGTYMFRLVGYFHTGDEEVENSKGEMLSGRYFKYSDGKRYDKEEADDEGATLPDFNLIVDTLFITCASDGNSICTLTLDPNGGEFTGGITTTIERNVTFGSDVNRLPKPTKEGATLLGWYYMVGDEQVDFEFGNPVTKSMTLYAKWAQAYTVTFDANEGNLPEGASNTAQTDNAGHLTQAQLNAVKPTRTGYKFLGWYTTETGNTKVTVDYTFKASITVYARWEVATMYTVTFNVNGLPIDAIEDVSVYDGEKVAQPSITVPTNYTFVNWNSKADGTGTAYDFTKSVTKNIVLYAKYYAANGVYVDGVKTTAQFENHVTNEEIKVEGFEVTKDNTVVTLWYNQVRCAVKSNNDFAAQGATNISLGKGVYTFYYKYAGTGEWGLWIALDKY